jgi:hypothetical protein
LDREWEENANEDRHAICSKQRVGQDERRYPFCPKVSQFKAGTDSVIIGRKDDFILSADAFAKTL